MPVLCGAMGLEGLPLDRRLTDGEPLLGSWFMVEESVEGSVQ